MGMLDLNPVLIEFILIVSIAVNNVVQLKYEMKFCNEFYLVKWWVWLWFVFNVNITMMPSIK